MANALDLSMQQLRITLDPMRHTTDSDGQLLTRWLNSHEDRAFSAVVCRHAALVWRVSRGILHQVEDAEEIFQATFLVLARKAARLKRRPSITGWLHQTARHLALNARTAKLRRLRHEAQSAPKTAADPVDEISVRETGDILGKEMDRLSAVHREAILLCLYEGVTQGEAAKRLGCSLRTLQRRLERGRSLLRSRLSGRGLAPENALALTLCANTRVPIKLLHLTITTATRFAAGEAVTGGAALLAEGALRTLLTKKLAVYCTLLVGLGSLTLAGGLALAPTNQTRATSEPRLDSNDIPLPAGAVKRIGSNRFLHGGDVTGLVYMPDGKAVASVSSDDCLRCWDILTGKLRWRLEMEHTRWDRVLAGSADGTKLAVLSDFEFRLVASDTGKTLVRHELPPGAGKNRLPNLAISADLGTYARCFWLVDPDVMLFDAATGQDKGHILLGPKAKLPTALAISLSEDGAKVYMVPNQASGIMEAGPKVTGIMVFDAKTGKKEDAFAMENIGSNIRQLVLSHDHHLLANIHNHKTALMWDLKAGRERPSFSGGFCAAFSPDDSLFAVGGLNIKLFDTASGKERFSLDAPNSMHSLAFSPDGKMLSAGNDGGTITHWDIVSGKPIGAVAEPMGLSDIRFTKDGTKLLQFGKGDIKLWDVASAKTIQHLSGGGSHPNLLAVSPGGKLAAAQSQGSLAILDTGTGARLRNLKGHQSSEIIAEFCPDGTKLFSAGALDHRLIIWDVATGEPLHVLSQTGAENGLTVNGLAVSPDGRWLATAAHGDNVGRDFDIRLWEVATGKLVQRLTPRSGGAFALAFTPDSTRLVTAGGQHYPPDTTGEVQLWDIGTGKEVRAFTGLKDAVKSVGIAPDGRMLATGGADNSVHLWEIASGKERGAIAGHETRVVALHFSPAGRLLAAASSDAPVYLWDVYSLKKPQPARTSLDLEDRQKLWLTLAETDAAKAFQAVCELIGRPDEAVALFADEWKRLPRTTAQQMLKWVEDLSSAQFAVRKSAMAELERSRAGHEVLLRDALQKAGTLETRQRLEEILSRVDPQGLRRSRMLEVLEQLRTAPARQFLQTLAEQKEDVLIAGEAAAGLQRMSEPKQSVAVAAKHEADLIQSANRAAQAKDTPRDKMKNTPPVPVKVVPANNSYATKVLREAAALLDNADGDASSRCRLLCNVAELRQKLQDEMGAAAALEMAYKIAKGLQPRGQPRDFGRNLNIVMGYGRLGNANAVLEVVASLPVGQPANYLPYAAEEAARAGHFQDANQIAEAITEAETKIWAKANIRRIAVTQRAKAGDITGALKAAEEMPTVGDKVFTLVGMNHSNTGLDDPKLREKGEGIALVQLLAGNKPGAHDTALRALDLLAEVDQKSRGAAAVAVVWMLAMLDDLPAARKALAQIPEDPDDTARRNGNRNVRLESMGYIAAAEVRAGRDDAVLALARGFVDPSEQAYVFQVSALAQARVGRTDAAKANFTRAIELCSRKDSSKSGTTLEQIASAQALAGDFVGATKTMAAKKTLLRVLGRGFIWSDIISAQARAGDFAGARQAVEVHAQEIPDWYSEICLDIAFQQAKAGQIAEVREWARSEKDQLIKAHILVGLAKGLYRDSGTVDGR